MDAAIHVSKALCRQQSTRLDDFRIEEIVGNCVLGAASVLDECIDDPRRITPLTPGNMIVT
jgi:hypothetical protein